MKLLYLVRHARVTLRPDVPSTQWMLSEAGRADAERLAADPRWRRLDAVWSSPEQKAQETGLPLAAAAGRPLRVDVELAEARRDPMRITSSQEEYEAMVAAWLSTPGDPVHGWEPAAEAQRRIVAGVERLVRGTDGPLAVVSHGLVLSLYVAALDGRPAPGLDEWRAIPLPAVAVVDSVAGRLLEPFREA